MKKNLGIKFGFSLFKKRNEDMVTFYANDNILNLKIYPIIRLKLNQANFHENYKAYKKIGKGNFASVYLVEHKITK
jgi:calcium-dependent protein kinase